MDGVGKVDLQTAIMYPGTFFSDGTVAGDWCSSTYDNLWSGKLSVRYTSTIAPLPTLTKTVYDPSPAGYQMPMDDAFVGATKTDFPALGLRSRRDGKKDHLTNVYYGAACPSSDNLARYGYVAAGKSAFQFDGTQRAHALSVRPIKEQGSGKPHSDDGLCPANTHTSSPRASS